MTRLVDLIIGLGWIAFWAYWVTMAARAKRPMQPKAPAGIIIRFIIVALVLLSIKFLPKSWGTAQQHVSLQLLGLALFSLGLLLAIWARVYLGNNWGFPADKRQNTELITGGPYQFIRHPIYSGILLATIGTAVGVTRYWLIVFVAFGVYFVSSSVSEERYMAITFPDAYPDYVRKSKMFIPFIF